MYFVFAAYSMLFFLFAVKMWRCAKHVAPSITMFIYFFLHDFACTNVLSLLRLEYEYNYDLYSGFVSEGRLGLPREIVQGGTSLLWGPGDRLRLLSKLRVCCPIKSLIN